MFKIGHGDIGLMGLHSPKVCVAEIWNPSKAVPLQLCQMDPSGLFLLLLLMATRNPVNSPVEGTVVFSHYSQGFHTSRVVGWDIFHQQYY